MFLATFVHAYGIPTYFAMQDVRMPHGETMLKDNNIMLLGKSCLLLFLN